MATIINTANVKIGNDYDEDTPEVQVSYPMVHIQKEVSNCTLSITMASTGEKALSNIYLGETINIDMTDFNDDCHLEVNPYYTATSNTGDSIMVYLDKIDDTHYSTTIDTSNLQNESIIFIYAVVAPNKHIITYSFKSTSTKYKITDIVNCWLPDDEQVVKGDIVYPPEYLSSVVAIDSEQDGEWKLSYWKPEFIEMGTEDKEFIGYWEFTPYTHNVFFEFSSDNPEYSVLPDGVTLLTPLSFTAIKGEVIYLSEIQDIVDDDNYDGIWQFKEWQRDGQVVEETTMGDTDIVIIGYWTFSNNEHIIKFEFVSTMTGYELPDEINDYLPYNIYAIKGETITIPTPKETSYEDNNYGGTWKFVNWQYDEVVMDISDITVIGYWEIDLLEYKVNYKFIDEEGNSVPDIVNQVQPTDDNIYHKNDVVDAKDPISKTVDDDTEHGTWYFQNYDEDTKTIIDNDITFIGTWKFEYSEYIISFEFISDNEGIALSDSVYSYLPNDYGVLPNETYSIPDYSNITVNIDEDKCWQFNYWSLNNEKVSGDITINDNITLVGHWIITDREN